MTKSPSFLSADELRERIRVRLMLAAGISAACISATLWMTFQRENWAYDRVPAHVAWTVLVVLLVVAACAGAITTGRALRSRSEDSCIAWASLSGMICFAAFHFFTPRWPSGALDVLSRSLQCVVLGSVSGLTFGVFLLVVLLNPCMPTLDSPTHDSPARATIVASRHLLAAALVALACRVFFGSGAALLLLLPLLISALAFFILGWRERAARRALRGELLGGGHPSLTLSNASPVATTLPLMAEDTRDGTKRAVTALGVTAYRDNASQELAYVRIAEGAK